MVAAGKGTPRLGEVEPGRAKMGSLIWVRKKWGASRRFGLKTYAGASVLAPFPSFGEGGYQP